MYGVSGPMYFFDDYELNPRERLLLRSGAPVALTPKAFDTLVLLVENHGHMVSKDALMRHLWPGSFVEENNLSQNISLLRRSLKREDGSAYIETVPKRVATCACQRGRKVPECGKAGHRRTMSHLPCSASVV